MLTKGAVLSADAAPALREAHPEVLHVLWLEEGDVGEDAAAVRIAAAVAGPGTSARPPVESQARLVAAWRGMVAVDVTALAAVNAVDGVTVFTVPDGLHVDAGRTLAGVKVTPLAIDERIPPAGRARGALGRRRRRGRQRPAVPPPPHGGDRAPAAH